MIDYKTELHNFVTRLTKLCDNFIKKHEKPANVIFISNNVYWKLLEIEQQEFRPHIKFNIQERKVFGLSIKILGSEEGSDEMYVGIIEE
jgi:hypothetical protein